MKQSRLCSSRPNLPLAPPVPAGHSLSAAAAVSPRFPLLQDGPSPTQQLHQVSSSSSSSSSKMAGWQTSTTLAKITLISTLLGCVCLILGMATPYWVWPLRGYNGGIWGYCGNRCSSVLLATRAMTVMAALCACFCLILLFLKMCVDNVSGNKWVRLLPKIFLPLGALFLVIGVVVFGTHYSYLHWSYGLCVVAAILLGLAAICYLIDRN